MTLPFTRSLPLLTTSLMAALLAGCATTPGTRQPASPAASSGQAGPIEVGVIAINDFHGALEPPNQSVDAPDGHGNEVSVPAGGGAWLASAVDSLKARHANNVVVAAGDLTSASQLASSLYLDEPAVGVMNRVGVEFNAVGNHEFDRGWQELRRLQNGGCEKNTRLQPCQLEPFKGANYKYLAASTTLPDGSPLFPATGVKTFGEGKDRITVGFVGLSLKSVPTLVAPDRVAGLKFADEADTINRAAGQLKAAGADAVVVLIHQGGRTAGTPDPNGCNEMTGDIQPILDRLNPGVDVVVSGHTHWAYVCDYGANTRTGPILLTSAGVYGKLVTDITLRFDPVTHKLLGRRASNLIVQSPAYKSAKGEVPNSDAFPRFQPREDVAAYIQRYKDASLHLVARPVGRLSGPLAKEEENGVGKGGALGNLIADSQLAATRKAGAQIAFLNPFGIRTSLIPAADGTVTFGQIYAVEPFNNEIVTMSLTGAQIRATLEQGLDDSGDKQILAPSQGMRVAFDMRRPSGARITGITLDGKPLDPAKSYRVSVVNFLAEGGDGFSGFAQGTERTRGAIDLEALEDWLSAVPLRKVPEDDRTPEAR
ncbi:5'-nucleotidase [Novosphingobium sp. PhB57]|uniref:bifunctional metallophosphatase/5'-nucleotidase n=1 Tax=Novosphingobium sp. PhB57 TaxID=2485107 RepID=UPI001051D657|nr:bifunctional metallophosphatase/5'-nucleotidase [Novosphingobium sp. PhB57]TCU59671.1 5'-nucleotidase [Novosphingobium sp. PhB57]